MLYSTKFLLIIAAIMLFSTHAMAITYYISPTGNDANAGTSPGAAWRTMDRLQALQFIMSPGDRILFERGGTYPGQLTINSSGSAAQPIEISSYGTGALPEISGAIIPSNWTVHQGNIWRTSVTEDVKYVRVGSTMMPLARYPNTGWLWVDNSTTTSLSSAGLTQANNHWNGAELVLRSTGFSYENREVSSFNNGTLGFPALVFNPGNLSWGFFLQNKLSELDAPGEWFHDEATGTLYFWAPNNADPNTIQVKASIHDAGVQIGWEKSYITITDLAFRGQRYAGVSNSGGDHVTITGCTLEQNQHGISTYGSYGNYSNNIIRNTFASGMAIIDHHTTIANNNITDIALLPGLGESAWGYYGMYALGQQNTVSNNRVDNVGNSGIFIEGSGVVEKNVITRALATLNDGGGIYFDNADGLIIQDNFVSDLDGNMESQAMDGGVNFKIGHGIYFGNAVIHDVIVRRNTVHGCKGAGINVDHTMVSSGLEIRNNVLYDNDIQLSITDLSNYNGPGATYPYYVSNYNDTYAGNVLYCTNKDQHCMQQYLVHGAQQVDFGNFTNNKYFNPFNEASIFIINVTAGTVVHRSLDRWRAEQNEEAGSTISPHFQSAQEVTAELGPNLVANGTFNSNANGWSGWPTTGQFQRDATYLDNGALRVFYDQNTASSEFYLRNDFMPVENGEWYEMRFSTQSSMYGEVRAEFKSQSQSTGPLSMSSRNIPFSPTRRDVSVVFQSTSTEPGLMIFANQHNESTYWLDNVELHRVSVETPDPYERHILLKNPTNAAVTMPLNGCYSDVNGMYHSGSIDIQAWGAVVLAKEEESVCGLSTSVEEGVVDNNSAPSPYPNPLQAGSALNMTQASAMNTQVEVIDTGGRIVQRTNMAAGVTVVPMDTDLQAGHYVLVLRDANGAQQHRLVIQ